MKKVIKTTRIADIVNPPNTFKFVAEFDDGADIIFMFSKDREQEMLELKEIYDDFTTMLEDNWNAWCNPEHHNVSELLFPYLSKYKNDLEETEGMDEDELEDYFSDYVYDYWARSNEYECYARGSGTTITYFDENGIEWYTTIEGEK